MELLTLLNINGCDGSETVCADLGTEEPICTKPASKGGCDGTATEETSKGGCDDPVTEETDTDSGKLLLLSGCDGVETEEMLSR